MLELRKSSARRPRSIHMLPTEATVGPSRPVLAAAGWREEMIAVGKVSNLIGAVSRVRNTLAMSAPSYGRGQVGETEKKDQNEEFFGRPAFLTVRSLSLHSGVTERA
eukprot:Skav217219  [mRNA]  locus=scaffold143:321402:322929:- [translate_table: standard]